jgi:protein SCO1/2
MPLRGWKAKLATIHPVRLIVAAVIGLALAGGFVAWQVSQDQSRRVDLRTDAEQSVTDPTNVPPNGDTIGGPFTLVDQDGKTVTDKDYSGKYLLVYFGYTSCPDMCPTGLTSIGHALDQLGADADKVQAIFVTIDPVRDTPEKLKQYDASFHPKIVGLTGTAAQIAAAAKAYQAYYEKEDPGSDDPDYVMDHSTLIYLMDPQGKLISTFDEEVDPAAVVKALRAAWAKKPAGP